MPEGGTPIPLSVPLSANARRFLVVAYDVTSLSEDEVEGLTGEALVQAESSNLHGGVEAVSGRVDLEGVLTFVGHFSIDSSYSAILAKVESKKLAPPGEVSRVV